MNKIEILAKCKNSQKYKNLCVVSFQNPRPSFCTVSVPQEGINSVTIHYLICKGAQQSFRGKTICHFIYSYTTFTDKFCFFMSRYTYARRIFETFFSKRKRPMNKFWCTLSIYFFTQNQYHFSCITKYKTPLLLSRTYLLAIKIVSFEVSTNKVGKRAVAIINVTTGRSANREHKNLSHM